MTCKTVADLIALMQRDKASSPVDHDAPSTDRDEVSTPEGHTTISTTRSERNNNLRLLLENYEMFIPKENLEDNSKDDLPSFDRNISGEIGILVLPFNTPCF